MKLTFSNGYTVSIIDKNEYIVTPEVVYHRLTQMMCMICRWKGSKPLMN